MDEEASRGAGTPTSPRRARADATITVRESRSELFDHGPGPELAEVRIRETFAGDIEGDSIVRALQVRRADGSAVMVSLQRVDGRLGSRTGAFVLRGEESLADGAIQATWEVVEGSGTGDLKGLRGRGGFEGRFGQGSRGWLDYWFE